MNQMPASLALLSSALAVLSFTSSSLAGTLRAGLARIDITPTQPVLMAGYASRTNLSSGVHDPLSARAAVFEHDGKRLVLLSIDNLGFYNATAEPLRQSILEACQLEPSELLLCAIHTHSAPTLTLTLALDHPHNVNYTKSLQGKLVNVCRQALDRLQPVDLAVASGASSVGANRRETVRDTTGNAKIALGRNPAGPVDPEVQVLRITAADNDKLMGVVFAYATHSTSLGPKNLLISGDVHGLAEQFLERYFGNQVITPGFAGASGNIDPWYRVLPGFNTNNGWIPEPILLGTLLGEEVTHVVQAIQKPASAGSIRTALRTVDLPRKRNETSPRVVGPRPPLILTVGCLGDIAFVGWGAEVFNEIGRAVKAASPFPHTFIFTHCNGASGYVPTADSYPQGGYEVQSSPFAPEAAEVLVAETTRLLKELHTQGRLTVSPAPAN